MFRNKQESDRTLLMQSEGTSWQRRVLNSLSKQEDYDPFDRRAWESPKRLLLNSSGEADKGVLVIHR